MVCSLDTIFLGRWTNNHPAIGSNDQVPDFGSLSQTLVGRAQSGDLDAAGLQNILTVIGGSGKLSRRN